MSLSRFARSGVLAATLLLTACQLSQPVGPAAAPAPVTGPIRGTVRLPGGAPAAGATVTAFPSGTDAAAPAFTTAADAAGGFVLPVGAGRYNLIATEPGKTWRAVRFQVLSATTVDIDLTPTGSLTGRLTGLASPLGAQVFVPGTDLVAVADASGNFTLNDVPAGAGYTLTVLAPGCVPASVSPLNVAPAAATDTGAIALGQDAGSVTGTVSAPEELGPSGVTVELTGGGRRYTTTTAADGSFQLADVAGGAYTLSFARPGLEADAQALSVSANQATSLSTVALRYAMRVRKVPLGAPVDQILSYPRRGHPVVFRTQLSLEDGHTGAPRLQIPAELNVASLLSSVYQNGTLYSYEVGGYLLFRQASGAVNEHLSLPGNPVPVFDRLYSAPATALLFQSSTGKYLALDEVPTYISGFDALKSGNFSQVPRKNLTGLTVRALDLAADSSLCYVDGNNNCLRQALTAANPTQLYRVPVADPVTGLACRPQGGRYFLTSSNKLIYLALDTYGGSQLSQALAAGTYDLPFACDAIKADAYGNAWLLSTAQKLLMCYSPEGRVLARVTLDGPVAFNAATLWKALVTDGDGNLWISDTGGSYVFKISRVLGAD